MSKPGRKPKDARRARRRTLIIVATLVSLLMTAVLLVIIMNDDHKPAENAQKTPEPTPLYTPFVVGESLEKTVESLKGSMWLDRFDPNYKLRFDELPSMATETNSFTGTSRTFSITSGEDSLYLLEGQSRYPFYIADGTLYLDFGDPVGVVEYILVPTEND